MLNARQLDRMLGKLRRFEETLDPFLFQTVDTVAPVLACADTTPRDALPPEDLLTEIGPGFRWGCDSGYCWLSANYTVPDRLAGQTLYLRPRMGGYEAMLWVDGVPYGTFNSKIVYTGHGNHYCGFLRRDARAGETLALALEYYAGHEFHGCAPFEEAAQHFSYTFDGLDICIKDEAAVRFRFDLHTLCDLAEALPETSARRGEIINALYGVHSILYYDPAACSPEQFRGALAEAAPLLTAALAAPADPCAPRAGLIGHSHMDTAWLWHVGETVKKCARTYSNQLALMDEYPEYTFVQSSACHGNMILRHYPALFEKIKSRVAQGRYEPNGAVWVECDCNITGGEAMVRQFLWGQRFTREHFGFTSDAFWLPDTFGYSAAIPQIMQGCGVKYFLTTKIGWNDTNAFPYDTFTWQGIDGSRVFAHFNLTHCHPDAKKLNEGLAQGYGGPRELSVAPRRLVAYGFGDGGGGPEFEMIEEARRCRDLNGCPKAEHTSVSAFMRELEAAVNYPALYRGELYLELHRGTLTNQHTIKRQNRQAEFALRDLEILSCAKALADGAPADGTAAHPLWETLLLNQFHDILPGTCIPRALREAREQVADVIAQARDAAAALLTDGTPGQMTLANTLSFLRTDAPFLRLPEGKFLAGETIRQQKYTDLSGTELTIAAGIALPAFAAVSFALTDEAPAVGEIPFRWTEDSLETPFAFLRFDERGRIRSFLDKRAQRELRDPDGLPLGAFLLAEDVPKDWDNWDLDADVQSKFRDCAELLSREVVSAGPAALVIRQRCRLSEKSTAIQDVIFFADSPEIRFVTDLDWQDDHRFLKVAFDTTLQEEFVRNEIQFGCLKRPTTRNTSLEQAKFEVLNHKYTDLSETRFGVTILNDGKYGITAEGGSLRLSLHKGGLRPDWTGDHGLHRCVYSFLPHEGGFRADAVVHPAYCLNVPAIQSPGRAALPLGQSLLPVPAADNVIAEAVKPCEDADRAVLVRLYECEGAATRTALSLPAAARSAGLTNLLEEPLEPLPLQAGSPCGGTGAAVPLAFRPFEIKTVRVTY
ncbi:MAG: glycosyl hydrolase-related protein [Oscillospiraceae bacterium]|jgi:alpha-mannosidase|nr:glycosyl hydrolase-related protein [Oscillospiraceae bacterium]